MKKVHIASTIQSYDVLIGNGIRHQLSSFISQEYSNVFIITDRNVYDLYAEDIKKSLHEHQVYIEVVAAGEQSKSIDTFYYLHTKAIEYGLDRKSLIIALGGGVIGDLAGFVAATFMRGIDYIQLPTTILAHDSSVGGKVAINHEMGKNLIGSFYPPVLVVYDIETLSTLPGHEIRSGYAELLKEAMLSDDEVFLEGLLSTSLTDELSDAMLNFIETGINIKASFVQNDEKETGSRKFLNLGHTLGHALETKLGYGKLTHGEAVAIGMLFAMYVSEKELHADLPRQRVSKWLTDNNYQQPISVEMIDDIITLMKNDKKTIDHTIQMILLERLSTPVLYSIDEKN
ncbi:3-dehydroquinate synthase [Ornithinibacillus scapharcae]|uniref:3-dehydroquinate synthase n=1 Tax=Ornithinibacillus scapharcae TaxID=1147159 RepID=UPI000225BA32|nr:3-dehydroquinate synthase [Ornithinibacillus scapharcae]